MIRKEEAEDGLVILEIYGTMTDADLLKEAYEEVSKNNYELVDLMMRGKKLIVFCLRRWKNEEKGDKRNR